MADGERLPLPQRVKRAITSPLAKRAIPLIIAGGLAAHGGADLAKGHTVQGLAEEGSAATLFVGEVVTGSDRETSLAQAASAERKRGDKQKSKKDKERKAHGETKDELARTRTAHEHEIAQLRQQHATALAQHDAQKAREVAEAREVGRRTGRGETQQDADAAHRRTNETFNTTANGAAKVNGVQPPKGPFDR